MTSPDTDSGDLDLLDVLIEWINCNLDPSQVFDEESLEEWAYDNDFYKNEDLDDDCADELTA